METLYIYYVFPDGVVTLYLACGTFSELLFLIICQPEKKPVFIVKEKHFQKHNTNETMLWFLFDKHYQFLHDFLITFDGPHM